MIMDEIERSKIEDLCISLYDFDETVLKASDEEIRTYFKKAPISKKELEKNLIYKNITTVEGLIKLPSFKVQLEHRLKHVNVAGVSPFLINYAKELPELNMLIKLTMAELRKKQFLKDFE